MKAAPGSRHITSPSRNAGQALGPGLEAGEPPGDDDDHPVVGHVGVDAAGLRGIGQQALDHQAHALGGGAQAREGARVDHLAAGRAHGAGVPELGPGGDRVEEERAGVPEDHPGRHPRGDAGARGQRLGGLAAPAHRAGVEPREAGAEDGAEGPGVGVAVVGEQHRVAVHARGDRGPLGVTQEQRGAGAGRDPCEAGQGGLGDRRAHQVNRRLHPGAGAG